MRCKRHTIDFTSTIGVCSSCLHERLLSLAASTAAVEEEDKTTNNNNNPPVLIFPRSVSPYNNHRFITTIDLGISCQIKPNNPVKKFTNLFKTTRSDHHSLSSSSSSNLSRSWISSILFTGKSKKQQTDCYIEDVIANRRRQRVFCRGMSPARDLDTEEVFTRTPAMKTPGRKRFGKSMAGMAFCLSPLVRASPNCSFKRKIRFPSEFGNSGEVMTEMEKPHISDAASFCANRSKKLVDLGRVNPRR